MSQICALLFPLKWETVHRTLSDLLCEALKDPRLVLSLTRCSLGYAKESWSVDSGSVCPTLPLLCDLGTDDFSGPSFPRFVW